MSDVILIEHKIHDHPEGPSQSQTTPEEAVPSQTPTIWVPETDPFKEKLDARIGLANPDRNHQVKCEECGRFLKSRKLRKTHVMSYHPMTAYQCPFDPNLIFYTKDDLVLHFKQNHVICNICDTMSINQTSLEDHFRRKHPKSPPPKVQPVATSSPIPEDEPESEQVETSQKEPKTQPDQPTLAIQANVPPFADQPADTFVTYVRNHLVHWQISGYTLMYTARCHVNFVSESSSMPSSMEEHVKETHKASKLPQYHCKQDGCTKWFGTQIESFRHLRSEHRNLFKYRCKKCKNSFSTVQELFRHHKLHDKNHLPFEAKWSCSRCGEIFHNLNQLMEHTRIHTENTYKCDECNWRFTLISEFQNPMDKGPTGLVSGTVHQCKFCEKVCTSESSLTNHINNIHQERQNIFRCCKCGRKYNVFNMYIEHLGTYPKNEYRCHECSKQFRDAHLLSLHSPTHLIQCPFCSRTFKDMKLLEDHVNNTHGQAQAEENKKCSYCDAAFETVHELQEHSKIHRYFSCEICFAGFVSDVILIEHKIHDHPEGPVPSTSGVTDLQAEQAPIIHVPDPDPFKEKLDTRIGLVNPDRNHQVKCEECDRFLRSKKLRKLHVMCYHLMAGYQCLFDPNIIFYTKDDLVLHCKQNHILCKLCDTMSVNQASLEEHYRKRHPKSP